MAVAEFPQRSIGLPAVRQDKGPRDHGPLHEARQRARRGVRDHLEPDAACSLPPHFNGAHDQRLIPELAPALQARFVASQVGLVNLDLVLERFPLRVDHGHAQLVQERPGRLVAEPELALQLHRRQPRSVGRHQVGRPEPNR
jgi:hypothetical protein